MKTRVMVFIGVTSAFMAADQTTQDARRRKDFAEKQVFFGCLAFFCTCLYTSLHGAVTSSNSRLNFRHLFAKL